MIDSLEARRRAAELARIKKSRPEEKDADPEEAPSASIVEQERPEDYDYPALEAGIIAGDVIESIGDQAVRDTRSLRITLGRYNAGDDVDVRVLRGEEAKTFLVRLGRPPRSSLTQHQLPSGPPPGN
jgi:hypothetical protein